MAQQDHKDDFVPDDFEPDTVAPSNPQMNFATVNGKQVPLQDDQSLGSKAYEFLMKPLLPEAVEENRTETSIGANTPIIKDIWPGGITIPHWQDFYNELVRPMSAPIGIGMMGLEGLINRSGIGRGGAEQPLSQLADIPPDYAASEGLSLGKPVTHTRTLSESAFESLIPDRYKNELQLLQEPDKGRQFNIGDPSAPYQSPSAVKPSKIFPEAKASLDEINSESRQNITHPDELVMPAPGQAKSNPDISPFTANFTSPDITLSKRPLTKPIADLITRAQDQKTQWVATTERELADLSSGLSKQDRIIFGRLLDGQEVESANPVLASKATAARAILDSIHDMFPEGSTKSGEDVGYLDNYFTHLEKQPEDIRAGLGRIVDHHLGIFKRGNDINPVDISQTNVRDRGMGKPSSPFVEERSGKLSDLQFDVNKVFPAYVESAGKVIFDKPAVEAATKHLANIPDTNLKELATWYIRNYSNYDSLPGLHRAWNSWSSTIARTTARSLLGFNTGLQTLHLARIPANLWPELGTEYTKYGIDTVARHPIQAWKESARLGLLQNEVRPFSFKTAGEKFDSISNFLSFADYLDKTIGYNGFKKKFMDSGMSEDEAGVNALRETKRLSQTSDPARQMKGMSAESNVIGGEVASKLAWQFKAVPAKIVEQYVNIAKNAKENPKAAARMLAGVGLAVGANQALRTFHLDPMHMVPTSVWGAFGDTVTRVASRLAKGDVAGALSETALWATPGGKSIQRQINQGLSAFQK